MSKGRNNMKDKIVEQKANLKIAKKLFKKVDFEALGKAIQAIFTVSSEKHGGDCLEMAIVACEILKKLGVKDAEVVIGDSTWRVDGQHPGAVISHIIAPGVSTLLGGANARPYHAWIKLNSHWNVDFTTYQFAMKMAKLDEADGQNTPVNWTPSFLVFNNAQVSTYEEVQQSYKAGVVFYNPNSPVRKLVEDQIAKEDVDFTDDVETVLNAYYGVKNGSFQAIGGVFGMVDV